jgi:hypothetical protein
MLCIDLLSYAITSMSAATKSVVYYKSHSIRKFLQKLSDKQRLQCCLIVTPSSADRKSHNLKHKGGSSDDHFLSNFVDRSMFAISVEAGMRSVQSNITAAYPTIHVSMVNSKSYNMKFKIKLLLYH